MKNDEDIGPFSLVAVGPKKYSREFLKQLRLFFKWRYKNDSLSQSLKKSHSTDIGAWPLFFSVILITLLFLLASMFLAVIN